MLTRGLMEDFENDDDYEQRRPLGMVLLGGLYLFFFMLTMSTFGHPFPLLGAIYQGRPAETMVFIDSLICLYLFLGLMKRQKLTWYFLIAYNVFEIINSLLNLFLITAQELERIIGEHVDPQAILINNLSVIVAIILLTVFIYRHRDYFTNRSSYLF